MGGCSGGLHPDAARFEPAGRVVKLDTLQYQVCTCDLYFSI